MPTRVPPYREAARAATDSSRKSARARRYPRHPLRLPRHDLGDSGTRQTSLPKVSRRGIATRHTCLSRRANLLPGIVITPVAEGWDNDVGDSAQPLSHLDCRCLTVTPARSGRWTCSASRFGAIGSIEAARLQWVHLVHPCGLSIRVVEHPDNPGETSTPCGTTSRPGHGGGSCRYSGRRSTSLRAPWAEVRRPRTAVRPSR